MPTKNPWPSSHHRKRDQKQTSSRSEEESGILVKGRHEVAAALQAGQRLDRLWLQETARGEMLDSLRTQAEAAGMTVTSLSAKAFRDRFGDDCQGVVALMREFPYASLDQLIRSCATAGVLLALNGVEDPRNLGAIVRTAEAAGAQGIILPRHRAASMTEGAIRTAQGAASLLPICRVTNLANAVEELKERGFWAVGLDAGAPRAYFEVSYPERLVLVIGGENVGLGKRVASVCDELAAIPMRGRTSSLNVSVSTAIVLFDVFRRQGLRG